MKEKAPGKYSRDLTTSLKTTRKNSRLTSILLAAIYTCTWAIGKKVKCDLMTQRNNPFGDLQFSDTSSLSNMGDKHVYAFYETIYRSKKGEYQIF